MPVKPDLRQAISRVNPSTRYPDPIADPIQADAAYVRNIHFRPSRVGKGNVTGYYPPAVKKQLRFMSAERDTNIQDLVAEALNDLFAKYGKPEIVPRKEQR